MDMNSAAIHHLNKIFPVSLDFSALNCDSSNVGETNKTLFVGASNLCITSLLFQASVTFGYEGKSVVFICKEKIKKIPQLVHGMPKPSVDIMKHLKILYIDSNEDLVKYLAGIHLSSVLPNVLIIDNIVHYASQKQNDKVSYSLCRLLALIEDTGKYLSSKMNGDFQLMLSSNDPNANHSGIYERFFPNMFHVTENSPSGFQCVRTGCGQSKQAIKVTYSMREEAIILNNCYCGS